MKRYLVRKLTILDKGVPEEHSLVYVDINDTEVLLRPFDFERAGYEFLDSLTINVLNLEVRKNSEKPD